MRRNILFAAIVVVVCLGLVLVKCAFSSERTTGSDAFPVENARMCGLNEVLKNADSDSLDTKTMERYILRWMDRNEMRGASLAIMKNEKLIYCKGFGWADEEEQRRAEAGDIYRMASASKLITAVGIMKLVDDGKLGLDSCVFGPEGILKQFTHLGDKRIKKITVRHLLNHTSGFSNRRCDAMFHIDKIIKWEQLDHVPTADEIIQFQLDQHLRDNPGGSALYSNVGYLMLSRVIEEVSGQRYEEYIQESILRPIGCIDMHIGKNYYEERFPNEVRYYPSTPGDMVECYDGSKEMKPRQYGGNDVTGLQGAGGWVASTAELARLVAAIDGRPGVPDILTKRSIKEMRTIRRKGDYALGWARYSQKAGCLYRTGTMSGTCAYIESCNNGWTYVFLTNTSHYMGPGFTLSIGSMVRTAVRSVKKWPSDRNLFDKAMPDHD